MTDIKQTLANGTTLRGTYVIDELLATGGMGEVYVARHIRLPGKFAVKVLSQRLLRDPEAVARFCREASIVSMLRHPNVVQVFDFDTTATGMPFLVMECLEGQDLAKHVLEHGPMAPARVAHIVRQIASALESAHARGFVHRDLKPANVMLVDCEGMTDLVKLLDFGVSKICGAEPQLSGQWRMLGTPSYMAPEQVEGHSEAIDGRADQFALGVLTYVLLTGADPFPGTTTGEVLTRIMCHDPEPLMDKVAWTADEVEAVLRKAMAKKPDFRYGTILEFADAICATLARLSDADAAPAPAASAARATRSSLSDLSTVVRLFPSPGLSAPTPVTILETPPRQRPPAVAPVAPSRTEYFPQVA
jgi:eukaryotic-like serine/threonine-protein kinase